MSQNLHTKNVPYICGGFEAEFFNEKGLSVFLWKRLFVVCPADVAEA
jgi:hypothetical protein